MTKPEAIKDAKQRTETSGLIWHVIRIRLARHYKLYWTYTYDTVSEHHLITHKEKYKSGHFKSIEKFEPETGTEIDLSYLNLNREARRKIKRLINTT